MIYSSISEKRKQGLTQLAVLIDPDKPDADTLLDVIDKSNKANVDLFFIGGSLLVSDNMDDYIRLIKANSEIPVVIFPGSANQISKHADGILFLSLISGRNPELLIGQHVLAAPQLKTTKLEIIPTGYILIDGGKTTTVSYMSSSVPIPADKEEIAVSTAMAGEMLGLKLIYMDAGSGAKNMIREEMTQSVRENIKVPLIIGGGIDNAEKASRVARAGADVIVVGNAIEKDVGLIKEISDSIKIKEGEAYSNN